MMTERERLLRELSALNFAIEDLNLFLDSHIESAEITNKINEYKKKATTLQAEYEEKYGPLISEDSSRNRWSWIANPWPWENTKESE